MGSSHAQVNTLNISKTVHYSISVFLMPGSDSSWSVRIAERRGLSTTVHLRNFRERLALEENMVVQGRMEISFLFLFAIYLLALVRNHFYHFPDIISSPLGEKIAGDMVGLKEAALALKWFGGDFLGNFYNKSLIDPYLAIPPVLSFRRQQIPSACPYFSHDLQQLIPAFAFCNQGRPKHTFLCNNSSPISFNILHCLNPETNPSAYALTSSLLGSVNVEAKVGLFQGFPLQKTRSVDSIVKATSDKITSAVYVVMSNQTLQAEISNILLSCIFRSFDLVHKRDVYHFLNLEFEKKATGAIQTHLHFSSVPDLVHIDWLMTAALVVALIDLSVQLSQVAKYRINASKRKAAQLNDDLEASQAIDLEGVDGWLGNVEVEMSSLVHQGSRYKEGAYFSSWNIFSDVVLLCLGGYGIFSFRGQSIKIKELADLQENAKEFILKYDSMFEKLEWLWLVEKIEGIWLLVSFVRFAKSVSGHPRISSLVRAVYIAKGEFAHFVFVFLLVQFFFAFIGYIGLGDLDLNISSLFKVVYMQYQMLGSQWPSPSFLNPLRDQRPIPMDIWLILNGVVSFFMLNSFFLAIVTSAYTNAEAELARHVVVRSFWIDMRDLIRCEIRACFKKWPERGFVIDALTRLILQRKKNLHPEITSTGPQSFLHWEKRELTLIPPINSTIGLEGELHADDPRDLLDTDDLSVTAEELSFAVGRDVSDMVNYYQQLFGQSFLSPAFQPSQPEHAAVLLESATKLSFHISDKLVVGVNRLLWLHKERMRLRAEQEVLVSQLSVAQSSLDSVSIRLRSFEQDKGISVCRQIVALAQDSVLQTDEIFLHSN